MSRYTSYIICGTPRSGSTLLCEMLSATKIAGRPNSYFRQQDISEWAEHWSVPTNDGIDTPQFNSQYIAAMHNYGRNSTKVFGLRLMWSSVGEANKRLGQIISATSELPTQFEAAFGPTLYVHLNRLDKIAQAISLLRAEQSGLWHLAADGSVLEGVASPRPSVYDRNRLTALVAELTSDETQWNFFFHDHGIEPVRLTYETASSDPQSTLAVLLKALDLDTSIAEHISTKTSKMSDTESAEWARRYRAETTQRTDNGVP